MLYGYHLVTDCLKANQGKRSHKDVEATIIHHFNTYTRITATKPKPSFNGKQGDILLSGITAINDPTAKSWHLDVTSTSPLGVTNQQFISRTALGHLPAPAEHDPRNDVLARAAKAEADKHAKYDDIYSRSRNPAVRARDDGRARRLYCGGVLPLHQAPARLGSAVGRATAQAQEGRFALRRARSAKSPQPLMPPAVTAAARRHCAR